MLLSEEIWAMELMAQLKSNMPPDMYSTSMCREFGYCFQIESHSTLSQVFGDFILHSSETKEDLAVQLRQVYLNMLIFYDEEDMHDFLYAQLDIINAKMTTCLQPLFSGFRALLISIRSKLDMEFMFDPSNTWNNRKKGGSCFSRVICDFEQMKLSSKTLLYESLYKIGREYADSYISRPNIKHSTWAMFFVETFGPTSRACSKAWKGSEENIRKIWKWWRASHFERPMFLGEQEESEFIADRTQVLEYISWEFDTHEACEDKCDMHDPIEHMAHFEIQLARFSEESWSCMHAWCSANAGSNARGRYARFLRDRNVFFKRCASGNSKAATFEEFTLERKRHAEWTKSKRSLAFTSRRSVQEEERCESEEEVLLAQRNLKRARDAYVAQVESRQRFFTIQSEGLNAKLEIIRAKKGGDKN